MDRIVLITTTYCNKTCDYCDIPLLKESKIFLDHYFNWISSNFKEVEFTGGEIGTLNSERINLLFNSFKDNDIYVCTNGLFIDRYFNEYSSRIKGVLYHIVDFDNFYLIEDPRFQYDIIVCKSNIKDVISFSKTVNINNINLKLAHLRTPNKDNLLDQDDIKLLKDNNLLNNYLPCEKNLYSLLLMKCCKSPILKTIDLTTNRIMHCCTRYSDIKTWPINKYNLNRFKNNTLFNEVSFHECNGCTLVYKFKNLILCRDKL